MAMEDDDREWDEAWQEDEADTSTEPPQELPPDPPADEKPADDLETLKQKLKSAEGRFVKFEEHIEELREKVAAQEAPEETGEPEDDGSEPLELPEGWNQDDWQDFSADYPVQAELYSKQLRQVQQLSQRLDNSEQRNHAERQAREADQAILSAHPDYRELLSSERQQIVEFIEGQKNPVLKSAYHQIYNEGTADQIIDLVSDYKARGRSGQPQKSSVSQRMDDALAVPGRPAQPVNMSGRAGMPDKDDFDASWDYFPDEAID